MGELGWNKIFGALLAAVLVVMGIREVSSAMFSSGEGHGGHGETHAEGESEGEAPPKYSYFMTIADSSADVVEEVFDLGAALAAADPAKGERAMTAKCASCHNWEEGGPNGTGPNLYGVVGRPVASHEGFKYSGTLSGIGGEWTYEKLNGFLTNPGQYAPGTAMSFAGLRRDSERADVIAYLASISPGAPAFPDPLPAAGEDTEEGAPAEGEATEGEATEGEATEAPEAEAPAEGEAEAPTGETPEEATPEDEPAPAEGEGGEEE